MKKFFFFLLVLSLTSSIFASDLGYRSFGVKLGVTLPEDPWSAGFMVGANADMGEIIDNLNLIPSISYWHGGGDFGTIDINYSNIQIAGDVHYHVKDVSGLYAGGGISVNIITTDFPSFSVWGYSTEDYSDTSTNFGIDVLTGYEMEIAGLKAYGEARYNLISDLNTFEFLIGVYF